MSCSSCKSNSGVNNVKWGVMILGAYMLGSSIYGTIELIKNIIEYFK